jgi:hypothetical protein
MRLKNLPGSTTGGSERAYREWTKGRPCEPEKGWHAGEIRIR